MADNPFKALQKQTSKSFHDQKALIKRVLAGKPAKCHHCQQAIAFVPATEGKQAKITCAKGCTDIHLDIAG